jgi:HAD superfamily hydrolase (TIGR01509 family)
MTERHKDKAIISDMDGVLVDSFYNFYLAYKQIVEEHGASGFTEEYYRPLFGAKGDYTKEKIETDFRINLGEREAFMKRKDRLYMENALKSTIPFEQTVKAIKELSSLYRIAVASSSDKEIVNHSLKSISIDKLVSVRVSGDMVSRGKPHPETFIKARNMLGIDPSDCLVIEDSIPGMNSAYGAGIRCVCIIADGVDQERYDKADVIYRMNDLTSEMLVSKVKELLG